MDFGKAFDCVVIMEKPLTVLIYWYILRLLMCLYDKQYDVVLLYVYMMRPSSIKKIVIADDNFFLLGGEV